MSSKYIEVNTSLPVIKNTLPLIYDKKTNRSYLQRKYIKLSAGEPRMSVELTYASVNKKNDVAGILSMKSTFHIYSSHTKFDSFKILHECIVNQIDQFIILIKECELINYPLNKISAPTLSQLLPMFRKLFGPESDNKLICQ